MAAGKTKARRDAKHRVLRRGESIRADGKYQFKYHINSQLLMAYKKILYPADDSSMNFSNFALMMRYRFPLHIANSYRLLKEKKKNCFTALYGSRRLVIRKRYRSTSSATVMFFPTGSDNVSRSYPTCYTAAAGL